MGDGRAQPVATGFTFTEGSDIESQVDALLAEIDRAVDAVVARRAEADEDPEDAILAAIAEGGLLADGGAAEPIESLDEEPALPEPPEGGDAEAPADAVMAGTEPDADEAELTAGIDSMLDSLGDTPPPARERAVTGLTAGEDPSLAIDRLDHELATLIEDDIAAEPSAAAGPAIMDPPEPIEREPTPAAPPAPAQAAAAAPAPDSAPAPAAPASSGRPALPKDRDWRDWLRWAWGLLRWLTPIVCGRVVRALRAFVAWGRPRLAQGIELTGKPFEGRPAIIRSAVGWVAVYTAFLAACVWGFLAFREPKTPEPTETPVRLATETDQP